LAFFLLKLPVMRARTPWLFLIAALGGCPDDTYDQTAARGDLGNGEFVYGCLGDTDVACLGDPDPAWPRAVAVGGLFDVRFASDRDGAQPTVISPASEFAKKSAGGFFVQSAGTFALLAVNGNREVIDIKHLRAADIAEVRVQRGRELPARQLTLGAGERVELGAQPVDAAGLALAGALEYAWSSDDERVLSVDSLSDLRKVRVRGLSNGRATLHVQVSGADFAIDVTVGDGAAEDGGADGADASALDDAGDSDAGDSDAGLDTGALDAGEPDAGAADAGDGTDGGAV